MPNCTEDDVRDILDTGLTPAAITRLIARADAEMTARGIISSATYTAELLKDISSLLTAARASMNDVRSYGKADYEGSALKLSEKYRAAAEILIGKASQPAILSYNEPLPSEDEDTW